MSQFSSGERRPLLNLKIGDHRLFRMRMETLPREIALEECFVDGEILQQLGDCICAKAAHKERKHLLVIACHLDDEHDAGERGAYDGCKVCSHADDGEDCRLRDCSRCNHMIDLAQPEPYKSTEHE